MNVIQKIRGVNDLVDSTLFAKLSTEIANFFRAHDFVESKLPLIENAQLFEKTLGDFSDVVNKEMFYVCSNHTQNEKKTMCLRPEATASVMRAFLENNIQEKPWKTFLIGSMFRYERPQLGRYREFCQASIEMVNASSLSYDVYLIYLCYHFFKNILNIEFSLELNTIGTSQERRLYYEQVITFFSEHKVLFAAEDYTKFCQAPLKFFDCKKEEYQELKKQAPLLFDHLSKESQEKFSLITCLLQDLSITWTHNHYLVRGLDYYNDCVFEFKSDLLGAQSTFCSGGRYDGLASHIGSKVNVPSVGGAIGIERLLHILEKQNDSLILKNARQILIGIITTNQLYSTYAIKIQQICFNTHHRVIFIPECNSIPQGLKKANTAKADIVIIIGEDEFNTQSITIKNMTIGSQKTVSFEEFCTNCSEYINHL